MGGPAAVWAVWSTAGTSEGGHDDDGRAGAAAGRAERARRAAGTGGGARRVAGTGGWARGGEDRRRGDGRGGDSTAAGTGGSTAAAAVLRERGRNREMSPRGVLPAGS
eukprot:XP_020404787.1 circumsporozoite protein-like [Zea mays]